MGQSMLREQPSCLDGTWLRRHFADDWLELFVWSGDTSSVLAFQLCYDRLGARHAVIWRRGAGFQGPVIGTGEGAAVRKATPAADPAADAALFARLAEEFERRSGWIGPGLRRVIQESLLSAAPALPAAGR